MAKIYIVGTPIGNLNDITLRALDTLKFVDIIACEDTRVTQKLLDKFEITNKKLIINNAFTELKVAKKIIDLVQKGRNIAVVSDAGMPAVSDPGFSIIKLAREENVPLEFIPGVSALTLAFVGSGFSNNFTFLGFVKDKTSQRIKEFKTIIKEFNHTYVYFVSPHKLLNTLQDLFSVFNDSIKISLAKELTKIHETWLIDNPSNLIDYFSSLDSIKGEFTMCITLPKNKHKKINKYKEFSKHNN